MKAKKVLLLIFSVALIILELLPFGVILRFANPEGEPWKQTFSYFSLTPFGYANFGPFITALLSCVLLLLTIIGLFRCSKKINSLIMYISATASFCSCLPFLIGADAVTVPGIFITAILVVIFLICLLNNKNIKTN